MNDVKKNLPEWQRHMIAAGARQGREIVRAGIRALDRRSYEAERAAMIGRLRRAR